MISCKEIKEANNSQKERQTTINWCEARDMVTINTYSRKVMTKCKKRGYRIITEHKMMEKIIGMTFECPIYSIRFMSPVKRERKELSDEQKQHLMKNLRKDWMKEMF